MASTISAREPAVASEAEGLALGRLARALEPIAEESQGMPPRLRGPRGEELEVPETLLALLRLAVYHLERGDSVVLTPLPKELSKLEAASLLDVGPAELDDLLDGGEIKSVEPSVDPSLGRRIPLTELLSYRKRRSARRQAAIDDVTRMSQEFGLYDLVEMPPD